MPNKDVAAKYGFPRNTVRNTVKNSKRKNTRGGDIENSTKQLTPNSLTRETRKYQSMVSFLKKELWNLRKH